MTKPIRRRSPRLPDHNYAEDGAYFLTICIQDHQCLFGEIQADRMLLNPAGQMAAQFIEQLPSTFKSLEIDCFVVMPNHVHMIIFLNQSEISIIDAMQWYKSKTTQAYIHGVKSNGWSRFRGKLWQRSYHDHIIRGDQDLNRIRQYIINNPAKWALDKHHPTNL